MSIVAAQGHDPALAPFTGVAGNLAVKHRQVVAQDCNLDVLVVGFKTNTVNLRHLPGSAPVQSWARSVHFAAKTAAGWTETSRGPASNGPHQPDASR